MHNFYRKNDTLNSLRVGTTTPPRENEEASDSMVHLTPISMHRSSRSSACTGEADEDTNSQPFIKRALTPLAEQETDWDKLFNDFRQLRDTVEKPATLLPTPESPANSHNLEMLSPAPHSLDRYPSKTAKTLAGQIVVPPNAFIKVKVDGSSMFECTWQFEHGTCGKRFTRRSGNAKVHWQLHKRTSEGRRSI
jgi:hypothetical protein